MTVNRYPANAMHLKRCTRGGKNIEVILGPGESIQDHSRIGYFMELVFTIPSNVGHLDGGSGVDT